jgi:hypothetical protein
MKETERISLQIQRAFDGEAWYGPSVLEITAGIDANLAAAKPVDGAHSIWEIVLHLISTQQVLLRRLDGDAGAINLPPSEDWPALPGRDEAAWQGALERLARADRVLRERIAAFPDERLDDPLIPGATTAYNNFHGYAQHTVYHAAQIGLLKRIGSGFRTGSPETGFIT